MLRSSITTFSIGGSLAVIILTKESTALRLSIISAIALNPPGRSLSNSFNESLDARSMRFWMVTIYLKKVEAMVFSNL